MLRLHASLTIGDLRYDTHASAVRLRRGLLPIVDRLDVRLPSGVRVDAAPGDPVICDLDGGEGAVTAFTGTATEVRRSLTGTAVSAHGGGHRLARLRPSLSLEQVTVGDVLARLCADAEVSTGAVIAGPTLARYVATARATALEEATRLVGFAGAWARLDPDDRLHAEAAPSLEMALRHGREILSVEAARSVVPPDRHVLVGEGAGAPGSARGLWPVADFWAGGAPPPGPGVRFGAAHELRTTDDATAAGDAWAERAAAERSRVRLRCWLLPGVEPGAQITIADAPDHLGVGTIRVRQVSHRINPAGGGTTEVRGYDEGAAGAGLLGALMSAVGGLL